MTDPRPAEEIAPADPIAPPAEAALADAAPGDAAPGDAALPGAHRGGFSREFTAPTDIIVPQHAEVQWAPQPAAPLPRSAGWALVFAILGLAVSFIVGWGFLIGLLGVVLSVVALRRPWESRGVAIWAMCLSLLSLLYSAGWLWWAASQGDLFS